MRPVKLLFLCFITLAFCACGKTPPKNFPNNNWPVVCLGDSITAGYGIGEENAYPAFLAQKTQRSIVNLGVSGDTAGMALARFKNYNEPAYMVIVLLTGNDLLKQVDLTQTERDMREIVSIAQSRGSIVVIVETGGAFLMNKYKKPLKQIAKETNSLFVPAVMNKVLSSKDMKHDTIHPNVKGSQYIADKIFKTINPYL